MLLARTLWREGYDDHLAGHITIGLGDGTLLCNPWLLTWAEFRASDVIRVDLEGRVVEGDWPMPPGAQLHLELHRARPDVGVAVHHHPVSAPSGPTSTASRASTTRARAWAAGTVALVDEYKRAVNDPDAARAAVEALDGADIGVLANHGVLVIGAKRPGRPPAFGGLRATLPERLVRGGGQRWDRAAGGRSATSSNGRTASGSSASGRPWPEPSFGPIRPFWSPAVAP